MIFLPTASFSFPSHLNVSTLSSLHDSPTLKKNYNNIMSRRGRQYWERCGKVKRKEEATFEAFRTKIQTCIPIAFEGRDSDCCPRTMTTMTYTTHHWFCLYQNMSPEYIKKYRRGLHSSLFCRYVGGCCDGWGMKKMRGVKVRPTTTDPTRSTPFPVPSSIIYTKPGHGDTVSFCKTRGDHKK